MALTPEQLSDAQKMADALTWKQPVPDVLQARPGARHVPIAVALQQLLKIADWQEKLLLPNLAAFDNETVGIFSDYGGESGARYYTYSVLVCAFGLRGPFSRRMSGVRATHRLPNKEFEFKDLGMGQMRRAVPDYLKALDQLLPGYLVTVAVDKTLVSLFDSHGRETQRNLSTLLETAGLGYFKPEIAEKLLRVTHLTAFLAGMLAQPGQKLFWMTDHDAICPDANAHGLLLTLFSRLLPLYSPHAESFPIIGGARPFEERNIETLDLLGVTDLVAGSLDQYLTNREGLEEGPVPLKQGAEHILRWLAYSAVAMRKLSLVIRPGSEPGVVQAGLLEFHIDTDQAIPLHIAF